MERRTFLRLLGAGLLASLVAACSDVPIFPLSPTEEELRANIQAKYPISLLSPSDGNYATWDNGLLYMVDRFLSYMPSSFYSPKFDDRKLGIHLITAPSHQNLFPLPPNDGYCECTTMKGKNKDIIGLSETPFNPGRRDIALEVFTHELTHRASNLFVDPNTGMHSPHFARIETILGDDFLIAREKLYRELQKKNGDLVSKIQNTHYPNFDWSVYEKASQSERFYTFFLAGLGKRFPEGKPAVSIDTPTEFIAVLGQNYIKGKPWFYRYYSLVFESGKVDEFYNFTKDMFEDKEYMQAPVPQATFRRGSTRRQFIFLGIAPN